MLKRDRYVVLSTIIAFTTFAYMRTLWVLGETSQLVMSVLFGLAIWELSSRRGKKIVPRLKFPFSLIGGIIFTSIVLVNLKIPNDYLVRTVPFIAGSGIILFGFNLEGLLLFWRELTILFFLGIPSVLSEWLINPSAITAWFTTGILSTFGFSPVREGTFIHLFDKKVHVIQGCSGLNAMNYLLGISVVLLILFPIHGVKQYITPVVAVVIGFLGNACRIALLTYFHASGMTDSFDYWHGGNGASLFGSMSVILFSLIYWQFIKQDRKNGSASSVT